MERVGLVGQVGRSAPGADGSDAFSEEQKVRRGPAVRQVTRVQRAPRVRLSGPLSDSSGDPLHRFRGLDPG